MCMEKSLDYLGRANERADPRRLFCEMMLVAWEEYGNASVKRWFLRKRGRARHRTLFSAGILADETATVVNRR